MNRRPDDGDADVSASTPFRFGVRDADTRADLASVYCAATFAQAVYVPDEDLPEDDAVLSAAGAAVVLSMFNDAAGAADPGNPCDQTLAGDPPVYRVEKSDVDGAPQEGVLYVTVPAQDPAQPYSAKVALDLAFVTADAGYAYTTYADFVGVVVGFVYWPENTGVFLLFRDDGTKRIAVVGPSEDGIGTRPVAVVATYDWSDAATYSIHIDPTVFSRSVRVYVTNEDDEETLLAELSLDDLNEFLPSVRMGDLDAESAPADKVTLVFGLDAVEQGNYVEVSSFSVANLGRVLVYDGAQTGSSSTEVLPTELVGVAGRDGAEEWGSSGSFDATTTDEALVISAVTGPALYRRDEPDLARGEWLVVGKFAAASTAHPGVYYTGMGVSVEDGTRQFKLSLLDDFSGNTIGVDDADASEDDVLVGYRLPEDAVDWEDATSFALVGSLSRDVLRLYVADGAEPSVDATYTAAGYPSTISTRVSFGFVESGALAGDFSLVYLWVFPSCTFYEPYDATYPDAQGWTRVSDLGARSLADGSLSVDCAVAGAYDIYYVDDATYDETSGGALIFKAIVSRWTDAGGASSPVRSEFGPIAAVRTNTVAAQVRFVVADDGTAYVYLSNEASDYLDVLAQNQAGQAISAEVDLEEEHIYLLDVKPLQYVRLYLDYELAVEIAWPASGALRALPTNLPADAVLAWGSLDEAGGVRCTFAWVRGSVGRGYDLKVSLDLGDDVLDRVYGSLVDLVVDVSDED